MDQVNNESTIKPLSVTVILIKKPLCRQANYQSLNIVGHMTTETAQKFQGQQTPSHLLTYNAIGPNEESGFTHNKNREPVTFHADCAHKADAPGCGSFNLLECSCTRM